MERSVDQELAGWLHTKSCGQWLDIHMKRSNKCCFSGVSAGTGSVQHLCRKTHKFCYTDFTTIAIKLLKSKQETCQAIKTLKKELFSSSNL